MANFTDSTEDQNDELSEFDTPEATKEAEVKQEVTTDEDEGIPDKFKGKSKQDIVKAYEEAEKFAGRQAQEVGELRKLTDQILKNQLEQAKPVAPQAQEIDFFDDPNEAVKRVIDSHPAVVNAAKAAQALQADKVKSVLEAKHGSLDSYAKDPEFINYVKASKVRLQLMAAAENYDFDAADELLTTYKEIKAVKTAQSAEMVDKVKQDRSKALSAGSVDMASGTGESSKKVYRRADLIRLMQTDRARYEALQPEIMAAYNEGRVK